MMAGRIDAFYGEAANLKDFAPEGIFSELAPIALRYRQCDIGSDRGRTAQIVPVSQITYGTDYPYFALTNATSFRKLGLSAADLQAIESGNAAQAHAALEGLTTYFRAPGLTVPPSRANLAAIQCRPQSRTREDAMTHLPSRRRFLATSGAALALGAADHGRNLHAQGVPTVKVMTFPGLTNLPIFAGQHKNLFAKHGIAIELLYTPNSRTQREGLAKGDHQIIQTAADNPVAMVETAKSDAVIVTGGDNGFNRIIVQPEINSLRDLRGKTVVVDAPNTAFAFLLYKALKDSGLNKGDYNVNSVGGTDQRMEAMTKDKANAAAGIMGLPFIFRATAAGLKDLGPAYQTIGAYQSDCAAVMRDWAKANSDTLIRYIRAIVEGRRWVLDPANKAEATQLIVDQLKLTPDIAARSYAIVTDPTTGMAKDAKFDMVGFQNVLKLRAEIEGQWGGNPPPPDKYIDLSYYDKALAGL